MRDEIIRIILEAKDKMSGVVRNAEKNINQSFGNIRKDLSRTDRETEKFGNDFNRTLDRVDKNTKSWRNSMRNHLRGVQDELKKTAVEFNDTNIASGKLTRGQPGNRGQFASIKKQVENLQRELEAPKRGFGTKGGLIGPREQSSAGILKQELKELSQILTRSPVGKAVGAFNQGRSEAKELERQLREKIASTKEELIARKKALDEEIHLKREAFLEDAAQQRENLRREEVERGKNLDTRILKLNQAEAKRQAKRDELLDKRIRRVNQAFEDRRKKAEDLLRDQIYERKQDFYDKQFERKQALRDKIEEVKRSPGLSKLAKDKEIDALRKAEADINRKEQRARDEDIRKLEVADDKIKRGDATARDIDIAEKKAAAAAIRREDSTATDEKIRVLRAGNSEINKENQVQLASELRKRRAALEADFRDARQALRTGANEASVVEEFLNARRATQALNQDQSVLARTFRSTGNAFGDFTRGLRRGRGDLREIDDAARRADTAFARIGQTIGRFTKNIGNLVNLRWYILISAIQVLGQLVTVLAANLISLASSAALAASALGAGLAAAVAQAIPVVGLLAAAFSRVGAAFTAAQQANKANAQSSQDARAQAQAQTAAQQSLTDALYSQKQAVQALADARKQAQRDIVDAIFAERDANFALKDAEFAVLDAKQRLRDLENQNRQDQQAVRDAEAAVREAKARLAAAKAEGDAAEIEKARVALALAQQNLADAKGQAAQSQASQRQIKEQKLAVKEAQLQLEEARVAAKRQRQDTAAIVAAGVNGSKAVVDALHGVAQANRDVANAQQGVTDASKKQASAGNLLQRQLSQLDPAERKLYEAFRRIYKQFKDTFRPITDIIVNAVTGAVKRFGKVLDNAQFVGAFRRLARAIAKGITDLSKFFTSEGFVHDFTQFINQASKNIPTLIKIIENLTRAFFGLAKAGAPVFKGLLDGINRLTGRFAASINAPALPQDRQPGGGRFTSEATQTRGQKFIAGANTYLTSWLKLAGAIGRVFKYLFLDAAPAGNNLVGALTRMFNNLADFLRDNPQKVDKFFQRMYHSLVQISKVLFPLAKVLLEAFTGPQAATFTKFTAQVVLPGLTLMLKITQELASALLFIANNIPLAKPFLQFLVAEKALNRVFPATQKVTDAVKKMSFWFFKAGEDGSRGFTKIGRALPFLVQKTKKAAKEIIGEFALIGRGAKRAGDAIWSMSRRAVLAIGRAVKAAAQFVWEMAVAGVKAIAAFSKALLESAYKALVTFATFIAETVIPALYAMGVAMYASLGPWGLIAAAVVILIGGIVLLLRHFHLLQPVIHAIGHAFEWLFNWIKEHWKLLTAILLGPFGLAIYGIYKFKDKIFNFFKSIISWIKDHWKTVAEILLAIFLPGGLLLLGIYKFKDKIINVFKDIWKAIKNIFHDIAHFLTHNLTPHIHVHYWHGIPYPSITFGDQKDTAKDQNDKSGGGKSTLRKIGDKAEDLAKSLIPHFDTGGVVPGKNGKAVPVVAHAGEWVLNKVQQMKAASHLDMPVESLKHFLFGDSIAQKKKRQRQSAKDRHNHPLHGSGGKVKGVAGEPVKIIAHAGEWILDKSEQIKLAKRFREAVGRVATFLFGKPKTKDKKTPPPHSPGTTTHGASHHNKRKKAGGKFFPYNLVGETDDNGNVVYFIEDTEEQFLELSRIDALHMLRTNGKYIPKWIEKYGHHLKRFKNAAAMAKGYAQGGIVGMDTPTYAMGGVVSSPQSNYDTSSISNVGGNTQHKKIEQNFKVHTQGETDWNYVMRLAAMHAQGSF